MAIKFRDPGPWGGGSASDLLPGDIDENFWELLQRIANLENNPPVAVSIADVTIAGNTFTFVMTDSSTRGPYPFPPTSWNFTGDWLPSFNYNYPDVVTALSAVYQVLRPIASGLTFDPGATDGNGNALYKLVLRQPSIALPLSGGVGQVLAKASATDFDTVWVDTHYVPAGGSAGQALVKSTNADFDTHWASRSLAGNSDVAIVDVSTGDVLQWEGSAWVNTSLAALGLVFADVGGVATVAQVRHPKNALPATSGTTTLDPTLGDVFTVVPSSDMTINALSAPQGACIVLVVTTSGVTSRTLTFGANFKTTGTLATGTVDAKVFTVSFVGDGTNLNETARTTAM
jgi:hypothetical protein